MNGSAEWVNNQNPWLASSKHRLEYRHEGGVRGKGGGTGGEGKRPEQHQRVPAVRTGQGATAKRAAPQQPYMKWLPPMPWLNTVTENKALQPRKLSSSQQPHMNRLPQMP